MLCCLNNENYCLNNTTKQLLIRSKHGEHWTRIRNDYTDKFKGLLQFIAYESLLLELHVQEKCFTHFVMTFHCQTEVTINEIITYDTSTLSLSLSLSLSLYTVS